MRTGIITVIYSALLIIVSGCDPSERQTSTTLNIADILGQTDTAGYDTAIEPRAFHFPEDHASHPGFRNEWWYLTGNLRDRNGRRYGYQVTFFRNALAPPDTDNGNASAWTTRQIWMAHAAVTDIDNQTHDAVERFSRAEPGLAGAQLDPLRIRFENWRISGDGNAFPWRVDINDGKFSLELTLESEKPPVLHGDEGLSRKGDRPGQASYYYSLTRLTTKGRIRVNNRLLQVEGSSWLDREWSTGALGENQTGWDWFSLQFNNGQELMYYRLRNRKNQTHSNSQGSWIDENGERRTITPRDIELTELEHWQSASGRRYPVRWRLHYRPTDTEWIVQAAVDDQLMDLSFEYWEGAVEIRDPDTDALQGRGFLEMVHDAPP